MHKFLSIPLTYTKHQSKANLFEGFLYELMIFPFIFILIYDEEAFFKISLEMY